MAQNNKGLDGAHPHLKPLGIGDHQLNYDPQALLRGGGLQARQGMSPPQKETQQGPLQPLQWTECPDSTWMEGIFASSPSFSLRTDGSGGSPYPKGESKDTGRRHALSPQRGSPWLEKWGFSPSNLREVPMREVCGQPSGLRTCTGLIPASCQVLASPHSPQFPTW